MQFYYAVHIACFLEFSEMWTNMEPPTQQSRSRTDYWRGYYWMHTSYNRALNAIEAYPIGCTSQRNLTWEAEIQYSSIWTDMIQYNTLTPKNIVTVCYKAVCGNIYRALVNQMILNYNREILLAEFDGRDVMAVQFECCVKMLTEIFKCKCLWRKYVAKQIYILSILNFQLFIT